MAGDPRIRGEHEDKRYADWDRAGSSPHTRGARAHRLLKPSGVCIIPAYAGSTTSSPTRWRRPKDHPRIRGEHSSWSLTPFTISGSSPHTRGAHDFAMPTRYTQKHHPRIRGEHTLGNIKLGEYTGSSPHTRGAPPHQTPYRRRNVIIPAYAGSTSGASDDGRPVRDHPRIRGEHIVGSIGMVIGWGSSPHTRGAHQIRFRRY
mgnify:CR=1 FL=1